MEYLKIAGLPLEASCIALGTWAIGGWMWGGTEESARSAPFTPPSAVSISSTNTEGQDTGN